MLYWLMIIWYDFLVQFNFYICSVYLLCSHSLKINIPAGEESRPIELICYIEQVCQSQFDHDEIVIL